MSSKQYNPEGRRRMAFWLSDDEHEKLHRIADANGLTMSAQIASWIGAFSDETGRLTEEGVPVCCDPKLSEAVTAAESLDLVSTVIDGVYNKYFADGKAFAQQAPAKPAKKKRKKTAVEAVNELSRELAAGQLGVEDAEARLQQARALPCTSTWGERLACIMGAAGFAYLFGGTPLDAAVAAVAGLFEILICQWFGAHKINRIFTDIVAAFACTIWSVGVQAVLPAVNANAAIIGALMVLTPGVALTMGVRDILNGDYLSGSIRLLDAVLIAGSIAGGVVLGWLVIHGLGVAA